MGKALQIGGFFITFLSVLFGAGSWYYAYKADDRATAAEQQQSQLTAQNADLRRQLGRQLDSDTASLRNYIKYYSQLVNDLKDAITHYRDAETRASRIKNPAERQRTIDSAKRDVLAKANALVTFVHDWRTLISVLNNQDLLDGDIDNIDSEVQSGDVNAIDNTTRALQAGLPARFETLERSLRQFYQSQIQLAPAPNMPPT